VLLTTRPFNGPGITTYSGHVFHTGIPQIRPACGRGTVTAGLSWTMTGPGYKGMDPSDPLTYVRPWNPQPGMIAQLNYDGAQLQGRTPYQLHLGPQARKPRRLRISG
jgi:hypothetical protein